MSIANRHADIDFAAEDTTAVDSAISQIETKTAVYPVAEADVVKRLAKMGPQTGSFAREALEVARQHVDLLPRGLDLSRFGKALDNYDALRQRYLRVALLASRLRSTLTLLGADAVSDGLDVYYALQRGTGDVLREDVARLKRHFEQASEVTEEPAPDPVPQA
jgi:hypothetical protein